MDKTCYIVGGGSLRAGDLPFCTQPDDCLMAADSGYAYCLAHGMQPDLLIGDFDSMSKPDVSCETIQLPVEKDDTDIGFCIHEGFRRGYTRFVIYGALGGDRLSHTVANVQLLVAIANRGGEGILVCGNTTVQVLSESQMLYLEEQTGGICSVFALSETATVTLDGLQYPLKKTELSRSFPLGVSNHFIGQEAAIMVHKGQVLVITEQE